MHDPRATSSADAHGHSGVPLPAVLAETLSVQALGTMAVLVLSAIAPAAALSLGVPARFIGYQITIIYFAGMASSLVAGSLVARHGGCRMGQVAMAVTAVGCLLASAGGIPAIVAGSVLIGIAYGLINPAASELLIRHAPPRRRNLIFSIKQAGVPLGGIAVGAIGPWIALRFGWYSALWAVAGACLVAMAAAQAGRRALDHPEARPRAAFVLPAASLGRVFRDPSLRWLALSSFCFSAVQLSVVAFLVTLLVEERSVSLVTAGLALAAVQFSGAFGRVLWGAVADALRNGLAVLALLAAIMTVAAGAIALATDMPVAVLLVLLVVLGLTANSWNGVYLSEVARLSPAGSVGATTGAAMFFTFTGVAVGPSLLSQLHDVFGGYQRSYALVAAFAAAAACFIALVRRGEKRTPAGDSAGGRGDKD